MASSGLSDQVANNCSAALSTTWTRANVSAKTGSNGKLAALWSPAPGRALTHHHPQNDPFEEEDMAKEEDTETGGGHDPFSSDFG